MSDDDTRAGLPPIDMSRPFNAVGGLWESHDKRGRACLKGQVTIAGLVLTVIAYPPMKTDNPKAPAWVLSASSADMAELETRLDEIRNAPGQLAFPF
jgi:hypothetical protein